MHLCGIDGDDVTRLNRHGAATAVRGLRAMINDTKPKLIMRVARERPVAGGKEGKHSWQGTAAGDKTFSHEGMPPILAQLTAIRGRLFVI